MERTIQIVADATAGARVAAEIYLSAAKKAVAEAGRFTVVLSGGSTPKAFYSWLASDAELRSHVPWQQTYFFFGDERMAPPDSADSNYRMALEAMLSRAPVSESQVFRVKGELSNPDEAASDYEHALRQFFGLGPGELPRFDLVILGMGPDGHTASLFPGTAALHERNRLVIANWVPKLNTHRITMIVPVLNNAALVMFMVFGLEKAQALRAALEGAYQREQLPSQLIHPQNGTLLWLADKAAATLLDKTLIPAAVT